MEDTSKLGSDFISKMNPESEVVHDGALVPSDIACMPPGTSFQFERLGFFTVDVDSTPEKPVFNRTLGLKSKRF